MNPMLFPRMVSSHDAGWEWLMRVHPRVLKVYFFYALPMSLIPPAMLLYATAGGGDNLFGRSISVRGAWMLAVLFFVAEAIVLPVIAAVIQRIGDIVEARPSYQDAFVFAAVVPTPLWLFPLVLFIPSLAINGLALALALFLSGLLILKGSYRVFHVDDERKSLLLASSVLAAGLVAWVFLMILGFVTWGLAVS